MPGLKQILNPESQSRKDGVIESRISRGSYLVKSGAQELTARTASDMSIAIGTRVIFSQTPMGYFILSYYDQVSGGFLEVVVDG
jgi:hypothetical protein